eukprot:1987719-Pleurochrysis_carterae.AAC.1
MEKPRVWRAEKPRGGATKERLSVQKRAWFSGGKPEVGKDPKKTLAEGQPSRCFRRGRGRERENRGARRRRRRVRERFCGD